MVRIPHIRRQSKDNAPQGKEGKGKDGSWSGPSSGKDQLAQQFVLGTDKKIPFPVKPPDEHEATEPPRDAVVEETSIPLMLPDEHEVTEPSGAAGVQKTSALESQPDEHQVAPPPEAASVETAPPPESLPDKDQSEHLSEAGTIQGGTDALAILQAMPDFVFRIGPNGVVLVAGNANRDGAAAASPGTAADKPQDGESVAGEKDKSRVLDAIISEKLAEQAPQHVEKVLGTGQVQTFFLQVSDDRRSCQYEVRLIAFGKSEVLAVVRDVTPLKQDQDALMKSRKELEDHLRTRSTELIRVNEMLKAEVALRVQEEEVLRKSFGKVERLLEDMIGAITQIVRKKDSHTADHQQRVSQLACAIARDMGLKSDQVRIVRIAALLHDLGKIFVPAEILTKPGKLTKAEISVIRTHPTTTYQILKTIDFSGSIADVVHQHHERMDGSGYPLGLKGDGILLEARIIGVADVVEAMLFTRPHRPAMSEEEALKEIADKKGILYDPAVVESCLKLFAKRQFKFEQPQTQQILEKVLER